MERNRHGISVALAIVVCAAVAGRAAAQDRLVQQARDAATGAQMRLYQTATGARLEVEAPAVTIRKQLTRDAIVTTLQSGQDSLIIESSPSGLKLSGIGSTVNANPGDAAGLARAKYLVASSPLARRAVALIAKMNFATVPTLEPVLLTTRAFLLAAADDDSGALKLKEWMRNLRMRTQVVRTGGRQKTPTDCYKAYSDELLAAYDEAVACVNNLRWWEWETGPIKCSFVYEARVIAASTWYAGCASLGSIIK